MGHKTVQNSLWGWLRLQPAVQPDFSLSNPASSMVLIPNTTCITHFVSVSASGNTVCYMQWINGTMEQQFHFLIYEAK